MSGRKEPAHGSCGGNPEQSSGGECEKLSTTEFMKTYSFHQQHCCRTCTHWKPGITFLVGRCTHPKLKNTWAPIAYGRCNLYFEWTPKKSKLEKTDENNDNSVRKSS